MWRNQSKGVRLLLLFSVAFFTFTLWWHVPDREQGCYNRIRVGMPTVAEEAILEEQGFQLVGGDGNADKTEPSIVVIFDGGGTVTINDRCSSMECFLEFIDLITGKK
jgi:hypothetical protein